MLRVNKREGLKLHFICRILDIDMSMCNNAHISGRLRRRNDGVFVVRLGQPQLHPQMHGARLRSHGLLTMRCLLRFGMCSIDNI